MAEASNGKIQIIKDIVQADAVSLLERALHQRLRNLETDEVVVAVGSVTVLRHLHHVETEFGANVRLGILGISDAVAKLLAQLGKLNRRYPVDGRMAAVIRGIMRQRAE